MKGFLHGLDFVVFATCMIYPPFAYLEERMFSPSSSSSSSLLLPKRGRQRRCAAKAEGSLEPGLGLLLLLLLLLLRAAKARILLLLRHIAITTFFPSPLALHRGILK